MLPARTRGVQATRSPWAERECHPVGDGCPLQASKCPQEAGEQLVNRRYARGAENLRMARLGALLELFQALRASPRKGVLLNLTMVPVASHG